MGMPLPFRRSLPIAGVTVLLVAACVSAETPASTTPPHLRPETQEERALLGELTDRSATARALVAHIERSDLIVYVRFRPLDSQTDGRTGFLSAAGGHRYFVVELACGRSLITTLAILAHELHHACEIADTPAIVDAPTLAAHYLRIGMRLSAEYGHTRFETEGAANTGARVRNELLLSSARTSHERD
jgi:hypothetical protein